MTRIPFQRSGWQEGGLSDGTSEDSKPSPLYTGPKCTCTPEGKYITIDGEKYLALSRITDTGCPIHGLSSAHIPDPKEPAAKTGNRTPAEISMEGRIGDEHTK